MTNTQERTLIIFKPDAVQRGIVGRFSWRQSARHTRHTTQLVVRLMVRIIARVNMRKSDQSVRREPGIGRAALDVAQRRSRLNR